MKEWVDKKSGLLVDLAEYSAAELVYYRDLYSKWPQMVEAINIELWERQNQSSVIQPHSQSGTPFESP